MSDKPAVQYPEPRAAIDGNPKTLVLYGAHKIGKTTAVASLPGCLVLVLRRGSGDYASGRIFDIPRACEEGKFGDFAAGLKEHRRSLPTGISDEEAEDRARNRFFCDAYLRVLDDLYQRQTGTVPGGPVAPYVAHDDLSFIEDWVFELALRDFRSTLIGSSPKRADLRRVTDLEGQGNQGSPGWSFVHETFYRMLWRIERACPRSIILAHMRDKVAATKEQGEVSDTDVDVQGRMRRILLRQASATGFMFRDVASNLVVSFKNRQGHNVGAWMKHLVGKDIVLGTLDKTTGETVFDWSKIYVPEAPATTTTSTPTP